MKCAWCVFFFSLKSFNSEVFTDIIVIIIMIIYFLIIIMSS